LAWIGELSHLPAGVVVECVTCSALNAAVRAVGASPSFAEREALRAAEGAPANKGTDLEHAQAGLLKRYKLASQIVNAFSAIKAAVDAGKSVLIRGEYCSLPGAYRFQSSCAFSHCILVIPSKISGCGFIVDPLDSRANGQPQGKDVPWKFIQAYCDSDKDNALIVRGPAAPVPPPPPPAGDPTTMIYTYTGLKTAAVLPSTKYTHEVGGPVVGQTPPVATRFLVLCYSADGKQAALDGLYLQPGGAVLNACGWVPTSALTALADAIPPVAPVPPPVAQRTVVGVDVHLSDGTSATLK
jgi:hypothetical protein